MWLEGKLSRHREENSVEEWKPIIGFEGMYEVSNLGRIRSLPGEKRKPGVRKFGTNSSGYLQIHLYKGGVRTPRLVHHVVAEAFIGPRPAGLVACHNDGNRLNNQASNLRYDTQLGNNKDKIAHGTVCFGEKHGVAKLTRESVHEIRALLREGNLSQPEIAKIFGVDHANVSAIKLRKSWAWLPEKE